MTTQELEQLYNEATIAEDEGDYVRSFSLFSRGAEAGYAWSQNAVALSYDNGYGVEKDKVKAIDWFKRAWRNQSEPSFPYNIALTYAEMGQRRRAHYWWKKTFELTGDSGYKLWFAKFLMQSKGTVHYERVVELVKAAALEEDPHKICQADQDEARALLMKLKKLKK